MDKICGITAATVGVAAMTGLAPFSVWQLHNTDTV